MKYSYHVDDSIQENTFTFFFHNAIIVECIEKLYNTDHTREKKV